MNPANPTAPYSAAVASHAAHAAHAATVAQVTVKPEVFLDILNRLESALVFAHESNLIFKRHYTYVVLFSGFVVKANQWEPLEMPPHVEVLPAKSIR
ncbi:MAG: hypothetical protein WD768_09475 [Phycisphaeraceae bacterium]